MARLRSTIKKLMMALAMQKKEIYLIDSRQWWSDSKSKPMTKYILSKRLSQEEWNKSHPNKPTKAEHKNDVVLETFKELEILLYLVEQLKAGENDAE